MPVFSRVRASKILPVLFAAFLAPSMGAGQEVDSGFWVTSSQDEVRCVARDGNIIYIGGTFGSLGPPVGRAVGIDVTGAVTIAPKTNGDVYAIVPDGFGGWYIGGAFTKVGGQNRGRLAHILPDGTVSSWSPDADGDVECMALAGSTLYVGGEFSVVEGAPRARLAAVSTVTGVPTSWNPAANARVRTMALNGNTLYVGGIFTLAGGLARNRLAAIDPGSGIPTAWDPNSNGDVNSITVNGANVYAGGSFTSIGGSGRNRVAALDALSGTATSWNPNATGAVFTVVSSGTSVYVGGSFNQIGGATRNNAAAIDAGTGLATSWNPNANSTVFEILPDGSTVYLGGAFLVIGGQVRRGIAQVTATTGLALPWDPHADHAGSVRTLAKFGSTVYAGGTFTSMGAISRTRLAAIDALTGIPTAWSPGVDGTVNAIAVSSIHDVFVGTNATSGPRLHKISQNGTIQPWTSGANGTVNALVVDGSTVYIGGEFTTMAGQPRGGLAAVSSSTGALSSWNPNANGSVHALTVDPPSTYVGGSFTIVGGQPRSGIAQISSNGLATSWNPQADAAVHALQLSGPVIYAGGDFLNIGGAARARIAAIDRASGNATPFAPQANGSVHSIVVSPSRVHAGGSFTDIGGSPRRAVAELDPVTGAATSWNAQVEADGASDGIVYALSSGGGTLAVAGEFSRIGGTGHVGVARLFTPAVDAPWTSVWSADLGVFPDELCPWSFISTFMPPSFEGGFLRLATFATHDNMYYEQFTFLDVPETFRISARFRVDEETHTEGNPRRGVGIGFSVAPDAGNVLFVAKDTVFVWDEYGTMGSVAFVDTDDAMHTYTIEVVDHAGITVFQDDAPILTGSIIPSPNWGDTPGIWWGDITGAAYAVSEWEFFKHNASVMQCGAAVGVPWQDIVDGVPRQTISLVPYPNPFRGALTLAIHSDGVDRPSGRLRIYDVAGRNVRTLDTGPLLGGLTRVSWDSKDDGGRGVSSGVYFVRLETGGEVVATDKVTILR